MPRRSMWMLAAGALLAAAVAVPAVSASAQTSAKPAANPFGDPNLISMFDGKTLTGWTQSKSGLWSAKNGTIHGNGTARIFGREDSTTHGQRFHDLVRTDFDPAQLAVHVEPRE